jgi:hypothetical protein
MVDLIPGLILNFGLAEYDHPTVLKRDKNP